MGLLDHLMTRKAISQGLREKIRYWEGRALMRRSGMTAIEFAHRAEERTIDWQGLYSLGHGVGYDSYEGGGEELGASPHTTPRTNRTLHRALAGTRGWGMGRLTAGGWGIGWNLRKKCWGFGAILTGVCREIRQGLP